MPDVSNEVTISRSPADVFAFLDNAEHDANWRNGVLEIQKVSGDGDTA